MYLTIQTYPTQLTQGYCLTEARQRCPSKPNCSFIAPAETCSRWNGLFLGVHTSFAGPAAGLKVLKRHDSKSLVLTLIPTLSWWTLLRRQFYSRYLGQTSRLQRPDQTAQIDFEHVSANTKKSSHIWEYYVLDSIWCECAISHADIPWPLCSFGYCSRNSNHGIWFLVHLSASESLSRRTLSRCQARCGIYACLGAESGAISILIAFTCRDSKLPRRNQASRAYGEIHPHEINPHSGQRVGHCLVLVGWVGGCGAEMTNLLWSLLKRMLRITSVMAQWKICIYNVLVISVLHLIFWSGANVAVHCVFCNSIIWVLAKWNYEWVASDVQV